MAGGKMDDYEKLKYVALGLWGLSLCLPGYQTTGAVGTWYGGMILLLAPIAFLQPLASLALYANIPFWLALILRDGKASIILMWLMVITLSHYRLGLGRRIVALILFCIDLRPFATRQAR